MLLRQWFKSGTKESSSGALRVLFGALHRAERMMRRRVDGVYFKRRIAYIDKIVPRACGNDHRTAFRHLATAVHLIPAQARHCERASALHAQKLVGVAVYLRTDVTAHGNAHERYLQMLSRPECRPVIPVAFGETFNIHHHGLILPHLLSFIFIPPVGKHFSEMHYAFISIICEIWIPVNGRMSYRHIWFDKT